MAKLKKIFISPFGYALAFTVSFSCLLYGVYQDSHPNIKSKFIYVGYLKSSVSIATFWGPDKTQITTDKSIITINGTPILTVGDTVFIKQVNGRGYLKTKEGQVFIIADGNN